MGVAAALECAYAPACVLANESALAATIAFQANRHNPAQVPADVAAAAMAAKEQHLAGRKLTGGQRAMIEAVCSSGLQVTVGVWCLTSLAVCPACLVVISWRQSQGKNVYPELG